MKHTYHITGMTCNNCRASVEKSLNALPEVSEAVVNLEKEEVIVTLKSHLATDKLQQALGRKYSISEVKLNTEEDSKGNVFMASTRGEEPTEQSKLQQLKPLFLILGYITTASVLLHYKEWDTKAFMLDFMGLFYIVFSFFKLLDLKGFPASFRMYDPLAKLIPFYAWVYPFIEVMLGLMFLMRFEIQVGLIATLIVLGITTIGVTKTLLDKKSIRCACLGTSLKLPMTEATFIENIIMLVMAVFMLVS